MNQDDHIVPYGEPLANEYETLSKEELKGRLKVFIADLLEFNFEKLANMVYRHDVSEDKFTEALQGKTIDEQAGRLADLVIEREMQKVETRKAYRKHKEDKKRKEISDS